MPDRPPEHLVDPARAYNHLKARYAAENERLMGLLALAEARVAEQDDVTEMLRAELEQAQGTLATFGTPEEVFAKLDRGQRGLPPEGAPDAPEEGGQEGNGRVPIEASVVEEAVDQAPG